MKTKKKVRGGKLDETAKQVVSEMLEKKPIFNQIEMLCPNSGNCIFLGPYGKHIRKIFKDFKDFELVDKSRVTKIGADSKNGFVVQVPFQIHNYTSYAVLKCAIEKQSDNLFYEYLVGKFFINKFVKRLPCFVETYDLYEFKDTETQEHFAENQNVQEIVNHIKPLDIRLSNIDKLLKMSCKQSERICMMMQHFDNFKTLSEMIKGIRNNTDFGYDVFNFLYQVYFALDHPLLRDRYTHYDLHPGNICSYKPFPGKQCVLMRYHYTKENKVIEFKAEFLAKIIDYGRNYFHASESLNTREIVKKVCKTSVCEPNCGEDFGYEAISGSMVEDNSLATDHNIDPTKLNRSADLRVAKVVMDGHTFRQFIPKTAPHLNINFKSIYGTPSDESGDPIIGKVKSVSDFHIYLKRFVVDNFNNEYNEMKYDTTWKVAATIDVYDDGKNYTVNGKADPDTEFEFEEIPLKQELEPKLKPETNSASTIASTLVFTVMAASTFVLWYIMTHDDEFKRGGGAQLKGKKKSDQYLEIARRKFGPNLPQEVIEFARKLDTTDVETLKQQVMQNLNPAEKEQVVKIVREDFPGFDLKEDETVFGNLFEKKRGGSRKRNRSIKKQRRNVTKD